MYEIATTIVAAIAGSIIGSILTQRHSIKIAERKIEERKSREEDLRKRLISEYLTQLKYSVEHNQHQERLNIREDGRPDSIENLMLLIR